METNARTIIAELREDHKNMALMINLLERESNRIYDGHGPDFEMLQDIMQKVDESISCMPAFGKVIMVENNVLHVNMGTSQGVQQGDELTLFQMHQLNVTELLKCIHFLDQALRLHMGR